MQKNHPVRQTLRFRSWSRKGYAMFASLGRQVTIGCLGKGVTEVALKKQKGSVQVVCGRRQEPEEEAREGEASGGCLLAGTDIVLFLLPRTAGEPACGGAERIQLINSVVPGRHTDSVGKQRSVCRLFYARTERRKGC